MQRLIIDESKRMEGESYSNMWAPEDPPNVRPMLQLALARSEVCQNLLVDSCRLDHRDGSCTWLKPSREAVVQTLVKMQANPLRENCEYLKYYI